MTRPCFSRLVAGRTWPQSFSTRPVSKGSLWRTTRGSDQCEVRGGDRTLLRRRALRRTTPGDDKYVACVAWGRGITEYWPITAAAIVVVIPLEGQRAAVRTSPVPTSQRLSKAADGPAVCSSPSVRTNSALSSAGNRRSVRGRSPVSAATSPMRSDGRTAGSGGPAPERPKADASASGPDRNAGLHLLLHRPDQALAARSSGAKPGRRARGRSRRDSLRPGSGLLAGPR